MRDFVERNVCNIFFLLTALFGDTNSIQLIYIFALFNIKNAFLLTEMIFLRK